MPPCLRRLDGTKHYPEAIVGEVHDDGEIWSAALWQIRGAIGAANAMSGHYKEALQDLSLPAIQQRPEASLWAGYAAAATEQWHMADRSFPKSNRLLLQYPDDIAIPFTIYMAESALHLGHTDMANRLLDSINKTTAGEDPRYESAIDYLRGIFSNMKLF